MTKQLTVGLLAIVMLGGAGAANARGCIGGAVAGGVAGHFAHHPILGAAAGCAIGHHMAHRHDMANGTTHHHLFNHAAH